MLPLLLTLYRFGRAVVLALRDQEFRALFFLVAVILATGTAFYHGVEGWRWLDSFYFSVTTLTTVGYGDFYPHTDLGKIFTIIYLLVGIGVLLGFIEIIAEHARSSEGPTLRGLFKKREGTESPDSRE
jgi:hypothetical protein